MQVVAQIIRMATTPEQGVGWYWIALWAGHCFVGVCLGVWLFRLLGIEPILIDPIATCGYFLLKELAFDIRKDGNLRDSLTDTLGVGFGCYATTCLLDGNLSGASWTLFLAVAVGIYGLIFNLSREDAS